jgi:MraZ protein
VFLGQFDHSVDEKSRVIIPTRLRYSLGERFYMTRGSGPCIWVFADDDWRSFSARLFDQPTLDPQKLMLQRFFTAAEAGTDPQGRVSLPAGLRKHAGISEGSEVTIVGAGNRIEIWASDEWIRYSESVTEEMITESAQHVGFG